MALEETLAENTAAIQKLIESFNDLTVAIQKLNAQPEVAKNTGNRKRKGDHVALPNSIPVEDASDPVVQPEPASVEEPVSEDVNPPTYEEVKVLVVGLANARGREAALKVLNKFKLTNLKDATPEQYGPIANAIQEVLA